MKEKMIKSKLEKETSSVKSHENKNLDNREKFCKVGVRKRGREKETEEIYQNICRKR